MSYKSLNPKLLRLLITFTLLGMSQGSEYAVAEVRMPALFSDGMVLQQKNPMPVWGWAEPNEPITVKFRKQTLTTRASRNGRWQVLFNGENPGGPDVMTIEGQNLIEIQNILVGEVWLCSGQSNMAWPVQRSMNSEREIESATWPNIRLFTVERRVSDKPLEDVSGQWQEATPETVADFSGVAYFFGRFLHTHLEIPIGLIHSSWGGTPIESWMDTRTLEANQDFQPILHRFDLATRDYGKKKAAYDEALAKIEAGEKLQEYHTDPGNKGLEQGWAKADFDDTSWKSVDLPNTWESAGISAEDGSVWFRKRLEIPEEWSGKPLVLSLGPIDDFDVTYFNGEEIGYTTEDMPNHWQYARHYLIPEDMSKPGNAVIAVRVFDRFGEGGFRGGEHQLKIWPEREDDFIDLSGSWKYSIELELSPYAVTGPGRERPQAPMGPDHPHKPSGLYNGMIYPLAPFPIRGAIWYQGEANTARAYQYRSLLENMITDWRTTWRNESFYFGIVQLANYMERIRMPEESEWAELREAQSKTAHSMNRTWLAVTIDIGEADDIHPKNKQEVGRRLAFWPLKNIYRNDSPASGPVFRSYQVWGGKYFSLDFEHVEGGLVFQGNSIQGFTIAGRDRKFVPAKAEIQGNRVVVWSDEIPVPVAVRYGWANNPACNLYNGKGLPAVPFRTDNWPGITINRR
jgi:sialate O-acetylesterase